MAGERKIPTEQKSQFRVIVTTCMNPFENMEPGNRPMGEISLYAKSSQLVLGDAEAQIRGHMNAHIQFETLICSSSIGTVELL